MTVLGLLIVLIVLIVLEKCKVINLSNLGGSIIMVMCVCAVMGVYAYEWMCVVIGIIVRAVRTDSEELNNFLKISGNPSGGSIAVRTVLLVVLLVPFLAALVYIIQRLVRKPLIQGEFESREDYSLRCSKRLLTLGIITAVIFAVSLVVAILLLLPYLDRMIETFNMLLNPLVLIVVAVLTFGLGLAWLGGMFVAANSTLVMLVLSLGLFCAAVYLFSFIFGVAAAVRCKKLGVLTGSQAFLYGFLSLIGGWNAIAFIVLRKKLNSYSTAVVC